MNKAAKHMLIGSGVAAVGVVAVGAVSHTLTSYMMKVALDREMPKMRHLDKARLQLSGIEHAEMFFELRNRAGEKLRQSSCETVEITSYDGERLVGHWRPCDHARRIILAMHGWRSDWNKDFGIISDFWHENLCSVLYAEQRGQNNSGGTCMGFGLLERFDCMEWIKWIGKRCGANLPIYLAGVSMGATTVLMAAGLELPESVHGIIADCGFTAPNEIWKHVAQRNLHLSYALRRAAVNGICRKKLHMGASEYSTVEAMRGNRKPVLFIHGTEDHFVPVEMTYEAYKACRAPKQLFVVPGADHGMSYVVDQAGYQAAMQNFWSCFDSNENTRSNFERV